METKKSTFLLYFFQLAVTWNRACAEHGPDGWERGLVERADPSQGEEGQPPAPRSRSCVPLPREGDSGPGRGQRGSRDRVGTHAGQAAPFTLT